MRPGRHLMVRPRQSPIRRGDLVDLPAPDHPGRAQLPQHDVRPGAVTGPGITAPRLVGYLLGPRRSASPVVKLTGAAVLQTILRMFRETSCAMAPGGLDICPRHQRQQLGPESTFGNANTEWPEVRDWPAKLVIGPAEPRRSSDRLTRQRCGARGAPPSHTWRGSLF
jgi:hypothetical protein